MKNINNENNMSNPIKIDYNVSSPIEKNLFFEKKIHKGSSGFKKIG